MTGRRSQRGAAAVEFALLLPVLMLVLLGTIEFGYAFFVQGSVAGAAREGAREYAIHKVKSAAQDAVRASLPEPANAIAIDVAPEPNDCANGNSATVTVTYAYGTLTGWFDGIFGESVVLAGVGSMRCGG